MLRSTREDGTSFPEGSRAGEGEAAALFAGLDAVPALLLAVSGGPDSMALMLLAVRWAGGLADPPKLHVATVDHGLRPDSRAEAALVAAAAARLGLPHATLEWTGDKPTTRIQERARAARYALLVGHARTLGARHVVTAHHADDQAETILMRLTRGSGLTGLAGMRRESPLAPDVTLVRPLLGTPKDDLVALCRAEKLAVVDDPSNRDPAYARARLRETSARLAALGLDRGRLAQLGRRAARAEAALEAETDRVVTALAPRLADGAWAASLADRRDMQPEVLLRLLRRAIGHVVPSQVVPSHVVPSHVVPSHVVPSHVLPSAATIRLDRLEALTDAVAQALRDRMPHRATLGGARIALAADAALTVTPAPARRRGYPAFTIARSSGGGLD